MGYTTGFNGKFDLNLKLDDRTSNFLTKLSKTRRMKRDTSLLPDTGFEKYGFDSWGVDGEFYVDGNGLAGQDHEKSILNCNREPSTQPGLRCQWIPTDDGLHIEWNGGEKFYNYIKWLEYIIEKILGPRGYTLNGVVSWQGEEVSDSGQIRVENNKIHVRHGKKRMVELLLDQGAYNRGLKDCGINPYRDEKFAFLLAEINRLSRANAALREHMTTLAEAVDKLMTWFGLAERSSAGAEGSWSHRFGPTIAKAKRTLKELRRLL